MKNYVFFDVTLCSVEGKSQRFGETRCLNLLS
jgi:hypothetical protein